MTYHFPEDFVVMSQESLDVFNRFKFEIAESFCPAFFIFGDGYFDLDVEVVSEVGFKVL